MAKAAAKKATPARAPAFPRQSVTDSLRIPRVILDQNAGKAWADDQAAGFLGHKSADGPFGVELSSGIKYGFLERPESNQLEVSDLGRQILRPNI